MLPFPCAAGGWGGRRAGWPRPRLLPLAPAARPCTVSLFPALESLAFGEHLAFAGSFHPRLASPVSSWARGWLCRTLRKHPPSRFPPGPSGLLSPCPWPSLRESKSCERTYRWRPAPFTSTAKTVGSLELLSGSPRRPRAAPGCCCNAFSVLLLHPSCLTLRRLCSFVGSSNTQLMGCCAALWRCAGS